ncbi:MAG: hypothetical protein GEU87_07385 [Alphaproteobacteria bacterium]|nr:hypothetical protein [Alphaproteobacteria bacterium]
MNSKNDIRRDMAVVAERIANARMALSRNELVDLAGIPEKVRELAGAITDLAPEDAAEMRPLLTELLADFKSFAEEVRRKIAAIQASAEPETRAAATGRPAT